jgi:hypothetical protein
MSILETSALQDLATDKDNPIMTMRVVTAPDGTQTVDVVTKAGMQAAGAHLEVSEKQKIAVDISPEMVAGLEKALENSPVGNTAQTAALEKSVQDPAAKVMSVQPAPAVRIHPIDAEKAIYSVELNPAMATQKVMEQLDALATAQEFGTQSPQVVAKIKDAIYQARPDLQPQVQAHVAPEANAAQVDAQMGERIVATSSGSQIQAGKGEAQTESAAPVALAMAQESYSNEGILPHATSSGSQTDGAGQQVHAAHRQGMVATTPHAMERA